MSLKKTVIFLSLHRTSMIHFHARFQETNALVQLGSGALLLVRVCLLGDSGEKLEGEIRQLGSSKGKGAGQHVIDGVK